MRKGEPGFEELKDNESGLNLTVHFQSLLQRAEQGVPGDVEDSSGTWNALLDDVGVVVAEAKVFLDAMKNHMLHAAEQKLVHRQKESIEKFGELKEILHHSCGRWAWKVKATAGFQDLAKVGEKSLLREGHAESVHAFVKAAKEDRVVVVVVVVVIWR